MKLRAVRIFSKGPKSIFPRIAFTLFFVICISCICSFAISMPLISQAIVPTIKTHLTQAAKVMLHMYNEFETPASELAEYMKGSTTITKFYEGQDELSFALSSSQEEQLENEGFVFVQSLNGLSSYALVKLGESYVKLGMTFDKIGFGGYRQAAALTLIICLLLSATIITFFLRRFTSPLTQLSRATKEIAKGNFDVRIDIDEKDCDQTDMSQLVLNFNRMAAELSNIEFMKKDFINSVSHEFKTPIAAIQGFATMLQSSDLSPEEHKEFTNIIIAETRRLSKLSTNILKLAKLDSQEFLAKNESFSLDEQLRNCILILQPEWEKKDIELEVELDEVSIVGDDELLTQAWINILSNAIKFSNQGGEISVFLKNKNGVKVVEIKDNGIGMTEEAQKRIFEMFYQGEKDHAAEGNGLGLAIAKRIIDLSGGKITVESEMGKGTSFIISFS